MQPYLLVAAAAVFIGIAVWFRYSRKIKGEPAWWFFVWLLASAFTTLCTAISWWIDDLTISRSFQVVAGAFMVTGAFVIFLFARSFDHKADFTILFWSVPYQFALAGIIVNHETMHVRESEMWVLDRGNAFVWAGLAVMAFYAVLAIGDIVALYLTLRREGRRKRARPLLIILAAFIILVVSNILGDIFPAASWVGKNLPLTELGDLLGAIVLAFAFVGVREDRLEGIREET